MVLEPRVSPAFAITYFCNHCNIRFENTSKYVDTGHWPLDDLWPHVCWGHMCDSIQGSLCPSLMTIHQCMLIQWSILQNTTYILHTTYILRTYYVHITYILCTYYVQNEWSHSLLLNSVQARQKLCKRKKCFPCSLIYTKKQFELFWIITKKAEKMINNPAAWFTRKRYIWLDIRLDKQDCIV